MGCGAKTWYASDSMSFARQRSQMHEEAQLCAYKLREARRAYEQDKEDVKLHYRTTKRRMQHETDQIRSRTISQRLGQPQPDPSVESLSDRRRYQTKADLSHQLTTNQQALRSESDYRQQANRATSALRRDLNVERGMNDQLSAQNQALRIGALRREQLLRSLEEVRSAGLLRPRTVSPSLYLSPPPSSSLSSSSSASSDRRRHRSVSFSDSVLTYGERQEVMYRPRHH